MNKDPILMNKLPGSSASLSVQSEKVYETAEELYDYIDGGAELYLNYGFRKLARRIYRFEEENEIKAEIFEMNAPKNAYGVFSYSKDTANTEIGQGAQYLGGSLIFWQGRYFVSIFTREETNKSKEEVLRMGREISEAIGTRGELPAVFNVMPERSLVKGSTFFFHHHAWQNKFRYISNDNIFNIDEHVNALLNQYGNPQKRYYLLLVEYPDRKQVRKAYKKSRKKFSKTLRRKRVGQDEDGLWMGCDTKDRLLMFVIDAPSKEEATYLLDQTGENYTQIK
ncbi:MAG: hypothetical protein K9H65_05275 [Bacteroidales bacterium]|nr:hypothetical protein [Bacteroidales bacterium]